MGKMMKSFIFVSLFVCFFSTNAFALLLVDPYAGVGLASWDITASNVEATYSGTEYGIGARVAGEFLMLFGGLDLGYHSGSRKAKKLGALELTNQKSESFKHMMLGPVIGVDVPVLPIRGWVAYYLLDKLTIADGDDAGTDDEVYKGTGYKLGVGITAIPFLSINLEYIKHSYSEVTEGSTTVKFSDSASTDNLNQTTIFLSASIPLSLL